MCVCVTVVVVVVVIVGAVVIAGAGVVYTGIRCVKIYTTEHNSTSMFTICDVNPMPNVHPVGGT